MKQQQIRLSIAAALAAVCAPAAHAIDVTAGDWKLSFDGNVNAHYIYSSCARANTAASVGGGLSCIGSEDGQRSSSSVSNGLLPAALSISAATTQGGYDIGVTFGLYPGISTNDGGSPNLGNTSPTRNTALGTASLDVRQVFLTFGNADMGTVMAGRNIGLFQADAILNDMTLLGVGGGNGNYAAPTNTSLGSIGLGYIYTDWLAQINYTTPDISGFKVTLGIFDPVESLTDPNGPTPKSTPGVHGKIAYKMGTELYLSASFLWQKQDIDLTATTGIYGQRITYNGRGFDLGGKYDFAGFQVAGWYYYGRGLGTTGLFVNGAVEDATACSIGTTCYGNERTSNGFLAQVTYKIPETNFKIGVNYGTSKLDKADNEASPFLLSRNDKGTVGFYDQLTPNLLLLAEISRIRSFNQLGQQNQSTNGNIGAFVSF
ncbi:MAG: porin [Steroidobacteraceae bacterium]